MYFDKMNSIFSIDMNRGLTATHINYFSIYGNIIHLYKNIL